MSTRPFVLAALVAALVSPCASVVSAQAAPAPAAGAPPDGWRWSLDAAAAHAAGARVQPGASDKFDFVSMAPGWHITMGPGGALYDARRTVDHRFVVEAELILFPDAKSAEYGVFLGGRDLDDDAKKQWYAFVVRADGQMAVMHRAGPETHMVVPWTANAAVKPLMPGGTVRNVLAVRAEPDSIRFLVNGERVTAFARSALDVNGPFGFRIGTGVNLHITNLDVTQRLAPARR